MTIDIKEVIDADIRNSIPASNVVSIDVSRISVTVGTPILRQREESPAVPEFLDRAQVENCTAAPVPLRLGPARREVTESFAVNLGEDVVWDKPIRAAVDIPPASRIRGKTTLSTELTSDTTFKTTASRVVSARQTAFPVQECTRAFGGLLLQSMRTEGTIRYPLSIKGRLVVMVLLKTGEMITIRPDFCKDIEVLGTYSGQNAFRIDQQVFPSPAACPPGSECNPAGGTLRCKISAERRVRLGPSIGSQLSTTLTVSGVPGATADKEFIYQPKSGLTVDVKVVIVERDTQPKFDDRGEQTVTIPLPSSPGTYVFAVPVTVITRGGDRIASTRFVQTVRVMVR